MAGAHQDKERFFAYNLWLDQRGLGRVSFATYRAMFAPTSEATPEPQLKAQPEPQLKAQPEPQLEAQPEPQLEAQPEPKRFHLICWLDDGGRPDDPITAKIKKATCVPLSYMSYHSLPAAGPQRQEAWRSIEQALAAEPAAVVALWGAGEDLPDSLGKAGAGQLVRMPHPRDFGQPQVKAKFWQLLKSLMAKVAQHPSL